LSKSEKRYFKLFVLRSGNEDEMLCVELFDLVASQTNYDEKKLLKKAKKITEQNIPNLKLHLYKLILKSIRLFHVQQNADLLITELIGYGRILYNKTLYKEAMKVVDKGKSLAKDHDQFVLLLELIDLEKLILNQTVTNDIEKRSEKIILETRAVEKSIKNINAFSNLSIKMLAFYHRIGFIRNKQDKTQAKTYFEKYLPEFDLKTLSFQEKIYFHHCACGYHFFMQDFNLGYSESKKAVVLFELNPSFIHNRLDLYIKVLNQFLVATNKLNYYDEFIEAQKKLLSIKRFNKKLLTENINLNLFKTYYIHEINRHFMLGDFTGGSKIVKRLSTELDLFITKLDVQHVLIFYYKIACLYFGSGNYKQAIVWLNKIINHTGIDVREDIHAYTRILNLISHYELGNEDLIEYQLKATYRFLLKKGNLQKFHHLILQFLRDLSPDLRGKKLITQFSKLKSELIPLSKNEFEKRAFIYFDIISWLESKIEGKPVEEIIQEKVRVLKSKKP